MRAVLSFLSSLALGLMIAAILVIGATSVMNHPPGQEAGSGTLLDYVSVVIGLGIGLVIAMLGRISWSQLPGRVAHFVARHAHRLRHIAWAALFVGILIYF
jgi:hypothetical protein